MVFRKERQLWVVIINPALNHSSKKLLLKCQQHATPILWLPCFSLGFCGAGSCSFTQARWDLGIMKSILPWKKIEPQGEGLIRFLSWEHCLNLNCRFWYFLLFPDLVVLNSTFKLLWAAPMCNMKRTHNLSKKTQKKTIILLELT